MEGGIEENAFASSSRLFTSANYFSQALLSFYVYLKTELKPAASPARKRTWHLPSRFADNWRAKSSAVDALTNAQGFFPEQRRQKDQLKSWLLVANVKL